MWATEVEESKAEKAACPEPKQKKKKTGAAFDIYRAYTYVVHK